MAYVLAACMVVVAVLALRSAHRSSVELRALDPCAHGGICVEPWGTDDRVRELLTKQAEDWNRGDLESFASGYKNSPDILFIGRKVARGYDQMLANYKRGYSSREAMGTLTFSDLDVQPLDTHFATATGHYHLERSLAGGGNADGYFLLVLEHTRAGWKIVRDDTTALPPPAKP